MRPGEVLSLRRGCLSQDPVTMLWRIDGRKWKNAVDTTGAKLPEGKERENPWIVVETVEQAVTVLEQLHDSPLLFPAWILSSSNARDGAKAYQSVNDDLNRFTAWVNTYCSTHHRIDSIPADIGNLTASRFRRTLAWFICRRPRGLVAAAIQYGHLQVQITQGYSGSYASGFPDDLAFERWLARLDELDVAERRIAGGEHVSGPAADAYRSRVSGGSGQFAGHVIRTGRQARHILANPALQIHSGAAMTCVFTAATALCTLTPASDDARYTPDIDDCRPGCQNIARTEDNIIELRRNLDRLRDSVDDTASPPIRLARQRHRLAQIEAIVADHDAGATASRA